MYPLATEARTPTQASFRQIFMVTFSYWEISHDPYPVLEKVDLNSGPPRNLRQNTLSFRGGFIPCPWVFTMILSEAQMIMAELFKIERIQGLFKSAAIRRTIDSEIEQFPEGPKNWHIIVIIACLLFNTFQIIFHSNIFKIYFNSTYSECSFFKKYLPISQHPSSPKPVVPTFILFGGLSCHLNALCSELLSLKQCTQISCEFELCKF